jgi:molecular chaperone DnaK
VLALSGDPNPPADDLPAGTRPIAQYEYRFALPSGWTHTGGDPDKRRTEVRPAGAEQGLDRILVDETRLAFDSDADRARAADRLRTDFDNAGDSFVGFEDNVRYAGRDVIHYQERLEQATVDWYVVFKSHTQVSIGCQYTESGRDQVRSACETVVRTVTITE